MVKSEPKQQKLLRNNPCLPRKKLKLLRLESFSPEHVSLSGTLHRAWAATLKQVPRGITKPQVETLFMFHLHELSQS